MSKAILTERAARLSDAAAMAAIEAAALASLGYPDDALEERAARLDAMAGQYRKAARRAH